MIKTGLADWLIPVNAFLPKIWFAIFSFILLYVVFILVSYLVKLVTMKRKKSFESRECSLRWLGYEEVKHVINNIRSKKKKGN